MVAAATTGAESQLHAAAGARESISAAVQDACESLGARVLTVALPAAAAGAGGPALEQETVAVEGAVARALERLGAVELLVLDASSLFAARTEASAREALVGCLDATWSLTRAVAMGAFIGRQASGRMIYVAPAREPGRGSAEYVDATCAALENLTRTLSIEWARYGITAVTIAPGASTAAGEIAALVAYLASPAGAYFSGCLLDLRGPRRPR